MKTRGVSGSVLKWIAIIAMAIDHFGAGILENFVLNAWGGSPLGDHYLPWWDQILSVDMIFRSIGRPAFPVFCFLLTEGFVHTRNVKKYAVRMGIFALVSEIPFDLALWGRLFDLEHQNVYFTLLIGLLAVWFIREYGRTVPVVALGLLGGSFLAELVRTDYGAFGVILIVVLYLLRDRRGVQCAAGALCCAWEMPAPLGFLPVFFYNGERGRQPKWFFYWFYPAHLLLYYIIGAWVLPAVIL
ncbi:MAG: conjugal transfer protein TraX [Clostridiales bacterium]|nr:conjugal transfer protein TraX [Clostridiales bacterium]